MSIYRQSLLVAATLAASLVAVAFMGSSAPPGSGSSLSGQAVIFVDDDAPLGGDGLSWDTAYRFVQDALATAVTGTEIRVAQGIYKPDQDKAGNVTPGDRGSTFQLLSGVALLGGHAGLGSPDPDARDVARFTTVLSGDLNGDDGPPGSYTNNADNCRNVVTGSATDPSAVLDGFTLTGGNADGPDDPQILHLARGAGMWNDAGSPTVRDCRLEYNLAFAKGAGMYNIYGSNPDVTGCTFRGNVVTSGSTYGGGMRNFQSNPTVTDCLFTGNSATYGGGMSGSSTTVTDCTFTGNLADTGGGIYVETGATTVTGSIFCGNSPDHIVGNWADAGGNTFCPLCDQSSGPVLEVPAVYPTIQSAIVAACDGSEVVVADGVYTGAGNRNLNFGGKQIVVRSANGPANCIIDCEGVGRGFLLIGGETLDSVIQGFTIRNGSAFHGGGVLIRGSSATIVDCILRSNSATIGAAIKIEDGDLRLDRCLIIDNIASAGVGGVFGTEAGTMTVTNCVFIANSSTAIGALACAMTELRLSNTAFIDNDGEFLGGGIVSTTPTTLVNCIFSRNRAERGAGIYVDYGRATYVNCTFSRNHVSGLTLRSPADITLSNSILWGNTPQQIEFGSGVTATVTFTDIQGGWPGTGNINADPLFVQPGTDDLRLSFGSPALDQGSNAALPADVLDLDGDGDTTEPLPVDADGNQRVVNGIVDMGAYEGAFEQQGAAATEYDLDQGEAVILIPAGEELDPVAASAVLVINVSGPDNATFTVTEIPWDLYPDADGYRDLGMILVTQSLLADGEPFMTVMNPFTVIELEGIDPLSLDPIAIDQATGDWKLAVAANTKNSPGHGSPIGDRIVSVNTTGDWGWTGELGDYGLYFNPDLQRGFVWAHVDHLGDFGFGSPPCPGDCVPPGGDGLVNVPDLLALLHTWGTAGGGGPCDFDSDDVVNRDDLAVLISAWGLCVPPGQAPLTDGPGGRRSDGVFSRTGPKRDLDGSGSVGRGDLVILCRAWGRCRRGAAADLDSNGVVDSRDLMQLLAGWDRPNR